MRRHRIAMCIILLISIEPLQRNLESVSSHPPCSRSLPRSGTDAAEVQGLPNRPCQGFGRVMRMVIDGLRGSDTPPPFQPWSI